MFLFDYKDYVIAVDYTSKFFEISRLPNTEASTVINHTKAIFSRYGIPRELVSDNGPQFTSYEYKTFSEEWNFRHTTSSPRYSKSNGLVERNALTIKRALQKPQRTGDDPEMTILMLGMVPLRDGSPAPATKLMGRTLRTLIPKLETTNIENKPKMHGSEYIYTGQKLKSLKEGDNVRIRDSHKNNWMRKAKVVGQHKSLRSYIVKTDDGNHLRRNRTHLLLTRQPSPCQDLLRIIKEDF